ncbi:HAD-IIB family hydrolase [Clostridium botulinum]|uniref:HAD-IIB family hydrolase n=1 Tax=unclassified Clostridium TaxID=2614128 RepID=UPI001E019542|nr:MULTISPECIES: HAD-IIB family hydrolase [unclassified Clostridium]MBN1043794.1 HAD-IIB family hydrolase [Clostridium botulinum]
MKLLASDLDGTLVVGNELKNYKDLTSINKLKEHGHKLIVSTGRSYDLVIPLMEKYDIEYDYLLLCNGSLIMNRAHEMVFDEWVSNEISNKIINDYYNDETLVYVDNYKNSIFIDNPNFDKSQIGDMMDLFTKKINIQEAVSSKDDYKIISLSPVDKDQVKAEKIKDEIIKKYGEHVEAYRNQFFVDVVPKGCSKGNALKRILEVEDISKDNLYVVGDSFNDVSMFNTTHNSYTFNDSEEKVKEYANHEVDYVYEVIEELLYK